MDQRLEMKKTCGRLVKCNFCGHIWLSRSILGFVTCAACRNHVRVKNNTVTSDELVLKEISNLGPRDQSQAQVSASIGGEHT